MSVLARLVSSDARMERRTLQSSAFVPPPQVGVIDDFVGVHRAMAHMTVLGCVRLLSDTIAALPWKAYRRDSNGVPVEVSPQPAILSQPYPGFDLFNWKQMCVMAMALRGNSYHYVTGRDKAGYPSSLLPLHPDIVFLERRPDILMWFDPIYRIMGEPVAAADMIHMRRFTLPGEPWGLSPIRQAAVAIGMGLSAEEYGYRYFKESANPSGTLSTEQNLDEGAIARLQKNWLASQGGRRLPAILTNGFKWETLSISPEESQFLTTRQFQRSEICIMYGVPPILIGDTKETTAWGTGVSQINLAAVTYTFRPWTSCIESVISACLPRGQFVKFDYSALLRGDFAGHLAALKDAVQGTMWTANEARAEFEMPPKTGGDELLMPANFVPLGFPATAAAAPPKPMSQPGTLPTPAIGGGEHSPAKTPAGNGNGSGSGNGSGKATGNGAKTGRSDPFESYEQEMRDASLENLRRASLLHR